MPKNKESENMKLATTILANLILQAPRSPARKTRKQIAQRHNCDVSKVGRAERYIKAKLLEKISVLKILIKID